MSTHPSVQATSVFFHFLALTNKARSQQHGGLLDSVRVVSSVGASRSCGVEPHMTANRRASFLLSSIMSLCESRGEQAGGCGSGMGVGVGRWARPLGAAWERGRVKRVNRGEVRGGGADAGVVVPSPWWWPAAQEASVSASTQASGISKQSN
jgi:hypothetical protein